MSSSNVAVLAQFLSAAQVVAGAGSADQAGKVLAGWGVAGGSHVAVVVDPDISRLRLADPMVSSLENAGFVADIVVSDRGEPQLQGVARVVAEVRGHQPAACVGVGGGSTMDVAKLSAALVHNPGDVTDYFGLGKVERDSIPTIMVPTTAGTGSETTQVSMLSASGQKVVVASRPLMPRGAILDPSITVGLPRSVTAASGLDALSHAVESYLSTRANSLTMGASLTAADLIASAVQTAADSPDDLDGRMSMLAGAFWGGLALNASVVIGHSIAYTIANRTHLPHGVTCSMALPYCIAYNEVTSSDRVRTLGAALSRRVGSSDDEAADPTGVYSWLRRLSASLGIPASLADVGITHDQVADMVSECIQSYPRPNNPAPFDEKRLTRLYEFMFTGDVLGCARDFRER